MVLNCLILILLPWRMLFWRMSNMALNRQVFPAITLNLNRDGHVSARTARHA